MAKKTLIYIVLVLSFIILANPVYPLMISLNPVDINVKDLMKGGYYEVNYIISVDSEEETLVEYYLEDSEISGWISFEPEESPIFVKKGNPLNLRMIIQPPFDAPNGNYQGKLRFSIKTEPESGGMTQMTVQPGLVSKINLTVTGRQRQDCRVTGVSISSVEHYEDLELVVTAYNNGNVDIIPEIGYTITDVGDNAELEGSYSDYVIKPTRRETIPITIENDLKQGQYFIDVDVPNCKGYSEFLTFDIFGPGQLSSSLEFTRLSPVQVWNYIGDDIRLIIRAKNNGENTIQKAYFKGVIELDNVIIEEVRTETLKIDKGKEVEFNYYFSPKVPGRYNIRGNIYYDGRKTFEKSSSINVNPNPEKQKEPAAQKAAGTDETQEEKDYSYMLIVSLLVALVVMLSLLVFRAPKRRKRKVKIRKI